MKRLSLLIIPNLQMGEMKPGEGKWGEQGLSASLYPSWQWNNPLADSFATSCCLNWASWANQLCPTWDGKEDAVLESSPNLSLLRLTSTPAAIVQSWLVLMASNAWDKEIQLNLETKSSEVKGVC